MLQIDELILFSVGTKPKTSRAREELSFEPATQVKILKLLSKNNLHYVVDDYDAILIPQLEATINHTSSGWEFWTTDSALYFFNLSDLQEAIDERR